MRIKLSFILIILSTSLFAQAQTCRLLSATGEVQVRPANELNWELAASGRVFQNRETIRSGKASTAQIQTFDQEVFVLPENAQIEIRELQKLSRDEVVLELTALAMQNLPARKDSAKDQSSAFILHGTLPESLPQKNEAKSSEYIRREERGALALFEQGYFAGFILKWKRLTSAFPDVASEPVEAALIKAYEEMEMPLRTQQANEQFKQRWPDSKLRL